MQILEYFKLQFSGYARLTNWLVRNMNPSDATLNESAIHNELVEMKKCSVIYTTNFDDFIERSFELHHRRTKLWLLKPICELITGSQRCKVPWRLESSRSDGF